MKKMMFLAATAAVAMSSCSKTEVVEPTYQNVPNNPNAIGFTSNTTRASINDLTDVQAGFQVFGHTNGATAWYNDGETPAVSPVTIDGSFDYVWNTTAWEWQNDAGTAVEAPLWPKAADDFPMEFYAMFPIPASADLDVTAPAAGTPIITSEKTIVANRFLQTDHLAAYAQAGATPPGGRLSLAFNHILSKINVSAQPGDDLSVEMQSVIFRNINSAATYNYVTQTWGAGATEQAYEYRRTIFAGATNATNQLNPIGANRPTIVGPNVAGLQHDSTAGFSGELMLLPHNFTAITIDSDGDANNVDAITTAPHIEVLYRVEFKTGGVDVIGHEDINAAANTYYNAAGNATVTVPATYPGAAIVAADYTNGGAPADDDNLYIKALFPLRTSDGTATPTLTGTDWAMGNGYMYNLLIGGAGNGGYYADNEFYDEAGRATGLYHQGQPGFPVFDSNARIHFNVSVNEWVEDLDNNGVDDDDIIL